MTKINSTENLNFIWGVADLRVENMVYHRQQDYYTAIEESSSRGDCTPFVEFMLETIHKEILITTPKTTPKDTQRKILVLMQSEPTLTRKELAEKLELTVYRIKYHIKELNKQKKIQYIGSSKK
ncbi:winged helix-turn-helix domain-containing protein, partial [Oceanispirochaeta sp.]|uniref:winged helix-turn-helix domain-containing protein n=1 Tax=Oceanispirochaeta sp. TaxID=2035350 RepID=UPI00262D91C8